MNTRIRTATVLFGTFLASIASADLILNPGFEDNNPADGSFGDDWGSYGAVAFLDFFPNGNPGHATFFADTTGNAGGFFQAGLSGNAGTIYEFSIDASFEANWDADVFLGLEFFQGDDSTQIDAFYAEINESPGSGYGNVSLQALAPAGTAFVRPIVYYENVDQIDGSGEAATLDNARLTVVPEPYAFQLILVAITVMVVLRRRVQGGSAWM